MRVFAIAVLALLSSTACRSRPLGADPAGDHLAVHVNDARTTSTPAVEAWAPDPREGLDHAFDPATDADPSAITEGVRAEDVEAARGEAFARSLAQQLTIEKVLAGVYVRNPTLEAARMRRRGAVEQYAQVTYLDTILRQYASFLRSSSTRVRPGLPGDTVAQRFPFPGSLELKASIVDHAVEEAEARYAGALRETLADARAAFATYLYLTRAMVITAETLRYLEQLEETARGKLAAGTVGKAHVIQVQVQVASVENDLATLRRTRDSYRAMLRALLDLPPDAALADPAPSSLPRPSAPLDALQARAEQDQPAVRLARARMERMIAMVELAEQGTYPSLSAGLGTFEDPSLATGGSQKEREPFGTRPTIRPDPFFGSKDAYLREAREGVRAAERLLAAARAQAAASVAVAHNDLQNAWRLHDLYHAVQLAQARQAYDDALVSYGVDRSAFMSVIDALRQWLRFRLDADAAERDIQVAYGRLERAVGGFVDPR